MKTDRPKFWAEFAPQLVISSRAWRRALNTMLAEHNLSDATAAPLIALLRNGDRVQQSVLAERVGIEGPTLVRVLDGLESDGLIVRVPDDSDRRIKLVQLTKDGMAVAERCEGCAASLRQKILGDLDPQQVRAAFDVLQAIARKASCISGSADDE
ncbi:MarR family winged helix-turn-helix transcriptional regulator [Rhizobium sp. RAF56]|uniref:MarR family winged helix-turn-helix transcriptional regulator n=1 Tax=Rhizobium sp. RAF56 TaxID=3233062 RepID=UPI003F988E99